MHNQTDGNTQYKSQRYINSQNIKEKIKLLRLDYKYINNLKKEDNIKVLNEPLRNIVSLDTSSRYANYQDKSWNKKIIQKILDKNDEKINSLLNLSFSTWIDIFTYRQKWENNKCKFATNRSKFNI